MTRAGPRTRTSGVSQRLREFWEFYRAYTTTSVHAMATASLTALGLLMFIDSAFAWLAIASYVLPPVVLYATGRGATEETEESDSPPANRADPGANDPSGGTEAPGRGGNVDRPAGVDCDFDADGADADADGPDRDVDR